MTQQTIGRIKISFREAMGLLGPYVKGKILEQVKAIWVIILYLVFFQTVILGIKITDASIIGAGIALVVLGLAFFMEGLVLGLMPLGELVGVKLPKKSGLKVILAFAFVLGFLATLAEPAIQVLQAAGSFVRPWEAPLLFLLLNRYAAWLVYAVGAGVGIAVMMGMLRFYFTWSLKPFLYILITVLTGFTGWSLFNPNINSITGLAWDCGAVTTGPVTVPLVLALGIGISRMFSTAETGASGFGVVTLASLFPVISVFVLGGALLGSVPEPMEKSDFFRGENRKKAQALFDSEDKMAGYVFLQGDEESRKVYFDGDTEKMLSFQETTATDQSKPAPYELVLKNVKASVKAIGLLTIPIFLVLFLMLKEKLPQRDEIFLGLCFAVIGMGIFGIGIEIGLDRLGNQVGRMLPSSFIPVSLTDQTEVISNFDPAIVQTAVSGDGEKQSFFYVQKEKKIVPHMYDPAGFDPATRQYKYVPTRGPLFGSEGGFWGIAVILAFGFVMGYGATLAEPALNALGMAVEELTVGTFKKFLLMQTVAVGVGGGIALGIAKVIWDLPLFWVLVPLYVLLLLITAISSEEFVNIGWDSAGVTTGPITVPLVIAMGLGLGSQVGVIEGFGILASASVSPILTVLGVGLYINRKRKTALSESARTVRPT